MSCPLVKITLSNTNDNSTEILLEKKIEGEITIDQTMQAILDAQTAINTQLTEKVKQNK